MSIMVQVGDFFVRVRDNGGVPKLTVWNSAGSKIISEFVSSATPQYWEQVANNTSQDVVEEVQRLIEEK